MTGQSLLSQLQSTAGVRPSEHFLEDCQSELELLGRATSDAVLEQILHHDLRDVVRLSDSPLPENAIQLRQAVKASERAPFKATLPDSFRLLVQVEELLDVSQNAETRLSLGPSSNSDPSPVGNQQNRCLKMFLCDGYEDPIPLVAMEVSPIPSLSAQSLAGIKVLLTGSIVIRHGLIMIHAGHALVLGGCVPELVEVQKQALLQARRLAGVGVDPTIRALIWNPDTGEMEENDDVGEHESGDVSAGPAHVMPAMATFTDLQSRQRPSTVSQQPSQLALPLQQRDPTPPRHPTARHVPASHAPQTTPPPAATAPRRMTSNPYSSTSTSNADTTNYSGATTPSNPYSRPVSSTTCSSLTTGNTLPLPPIQTTGATTTNSQPPAVPIGTVPISFEEFRDLLLRARQNEQEYRQIYGKHFCVQLQQIGPKDFFNIMKKKDRSKDHDKYDFVMTAHFKGSSASNNSVTCRIASEILEPFFGEKPSVVRRMSKEDKERAAQLVKEGGRKVQEFTWQLQAYEVTLELSADDFFRSPSDPIPPLDGTTAVVRLVRVRS